MSAQLLARSGLTLADVCVAAAASIRQTIACIDRNAKGIALVVDAAHRLVGTVTDGDIRRALLAGVSLEQPVETLLERRKQAPAYHDPVTARDGTSVADLIHLMNASALRHIPLLDAAGRVMDVALQSELVKEYELPLNAVIMAGGAGTRIRPLTEQVPKPMLRLGDRPLLEHIIEQLQRIGIRRVSLTTHYKGHLIEDHFGDGRRFGVDIRYIREDDPMGTAGALRHVETAAEPLLVMNGDIVTKVDFRAMLAFHREHRAEMTVAVCQQELRVPYGVVQMDAEARITSISEKPQLRHFVNAGIYLLNPGVCRSIPDGRPYDMTELIADLAAEGCAVVAFPLHEYWQDIGNHEDYARAREHVMSQAAP